MLVVTDLDDTLIGDDEATAAFTRWWQSAAVPRGSRLVFNTGRSLSKCQALLAEKGAVLPEPDFLISSVGTKVGPHMASRADWLAHVGLKLWCHHAKPASTAKCETHSRTGRTICRLGAKWAAYIVSGRAN